ncbi:MAG: glycosyl hydrolase family 8 [Cytophagaceae bacterium]
MKTRALLLFILLLTAGLSFGQTYPFPQNKVYSFGMMPSNRSGSDASAAYSTWKTNFLSACSNGRYRVKFDDPNQTVSEGIGYGMLLSAYAGDRSVFDGLWLFYKDNRNGNGVMNWKIGGCSGTVGANGATDADEDAAMALIVAHYQWGSTGSVNYQADANALIAAIKSKEVESGSFTLKPGDQFGGSSNTNPSYFAPGYYRTFGTFTNDASFWNSVAAQTYTIINNNLSAHNAAGGLVSDWCQANGAYSQGQNYSYDACRTPWRIAVDYAWYGTASAKTYIKKSSDFVRVNLGGSQNIKDGYNQNGSAIGQWHNSAFVGGFASAALGGDVQAHLDNSYSDLRGLNDAGSYFNQTLKTLYLFLLTGNFYLPGGTTSTPPPPTQTLSPYGGTAAAIPGRIEAEKYDNGGSGLAYSDADATNSGGQFRTDGVDIETTTDAGVGYNVGYTAAGEWMKYSVNVSAAGKYDFKARVASMAAGKSFHIEMNGTNVTGAVAISNTGGWQTWQTVTVSGITLSAGPQVMRIFMDTDGFNLNYVDIAASTTTPPPANVAPNVSISSPANNASFTAGSTISISANATDSDGSISKVEFFQGSTLLGTSTASPYTFTWTNVPAGSYSLTAKATDNSGANKTSAAVSITVTTPAPGNVAPSVSISSPTNNASFTAGSTISISANATDSDGSISKVEFFQGGTLLGASTASPYAFTWTNVPAGNYSLTAKATDNGGATMTSSAVSISVTNPAPPPTGSCITEAVPNAADYVVRNDWSDNTNGSSVTNGTGAMKITHRQWGESFLWLIEANKTVNVVSGKTYTIKFDVLDDANNQLSAVNVGFASSYDWAGAVLAQPAATASAGYSSSAYTSKTVTITATSTQAVRLALKLNWSAQPNLAVNVNIKNISICESGSARFAVNSGMNAVNANAVFPNPFQGQTAMTINTSETMPLSMKIMDMNGTLIFESNEYSTNEKIPVGEGLKQGIYLLQVLYGDQVNVYKLMKD